MAIPLKRLEGKYEILEKLQEGGMGTLYKVRHRLLGELRVIKVMRPHLRDQPDLRTRFLAEARAATRLSHPHLARIYDCTVDEDGIAYIVMELIHGLTLAELLAPGEPLPLALGLEIGRQGLRAIGHLHEHRVAHRDVSPDNLMLTRDVDGRPLVKLIDLGIAKAAESEGPRTGAGVFLGKFRYAAPETFEGSQPEDRRRGDLYSFGLVLYELLTGVFPISGDSPSSLIAGHLFRPPLDFAESDPEGRVPGDVRRAVLRALAKSPGDRFADAASFRAALPNATELDLTTPEIHRILKLTEDPESARHAARLPPGSTQVRFDRSFAAEPTPAPTFVRAPPADEEADPERTQVLRPEDPSPAGTATPADELVDRAYRLAQLEDFHQARELLRSVRARAPEHPQARALLAAVEACLDVRELEDREAGESARTITGIRRGPGRPTEAHTGTDPAAAVDGAGESTAAIRSPSSEATTVSLEETLAAIRGLRDDGRAGEALKELNLAVQEFGQQPALKTLRHELGEALLERDAEEEETASRMFAAHPGEHGEDPHRTQPSITPLPAGGSPPAFPPAARGGLHDATIRSASAVLKPPRDRRGGPPVAHPKGSMVAIGLILAAAFALWVYFLHRQGAPAETTAANLAAAVLAPGSVAIDAVPWAEIVAIEQPGAEESPPIPASRFTPVILRLPPGEHRITLRYPPTGEEQEIVVEIEGDVRIDRRLSFLGPDGTRLDGDRYFQHIGW